MPAITQYYEINADEPERVINVSHKKNHASIITPTPLGIICCISLGLLNKLVTNMR